MNDKYLKFAKALAYEAGEIMSEYFLNTKTDWKEDNTPLTLADTTINRLVIERIVDAYPDHSVLGEEESAMKDNARFVWVCDPVDGTMPYSHGLPISTFSLALCDNGKPVVGVVYDPFMDRMFWGIKDGGAFCNGQAIHVNEQTMKNALIDLEGLPSTKPVRNLGSHFGELLIYEGAQTMQLWSAILPSALVASGEMSAVVFNVPKPEDGAAIKVIVEEAGGKVTDLVGREQRYDKTVHGFIASNGTIHERLIKLVEENSDEV